MTRESKGQPIDAQAISSLERLSVMAEFVELIHFDCADCGELKKEGGVALANLKSRGEIGGETHSQTRSDTDTDTV